MGRVGERERGGGEDERKKWGMTGREGEGGGDERKVNMEGCEGEGMDMWAEMGGEGRGGEGREGGLSPSTHLALPISPRQRSDNNFTASVLEPLCMYKDIKKH